MPARSKPKIQQEDIDRAIAELREVVDAVQLADVDKLFAMDLLDDYGRWCGISEAAWRDILVEGLTMRQSSGAKDNVHRKMVKSESIGIFKDARAAKTDLAMKISRLVRNGAIEDNREELDEFDVFNA